MALRDDPHIRNPPQKHGVWSLALSVVALLPPLYLVWMVLTQTVDVPFADQWVLLLIGLSTLQGSDHFRW